MDHQYDFGMIGLGVMGRNFLLNLADSGFSSAGLDRSEEQVAALERESGDLPVMATTSTETFVNALKQPRRIMLLVPAGKVVDSVIESLLPYLAEGDIIIDGGNSHFDDTERRFKELAKKNLEFLGTGVSGGAKGARLGPSIMPGGSRAAWEKVQPIMEAVAAKVDGEPCVDYMGHRSAGHYVKMVHNGIEYGLMQLLAETYDILKRAGGMSNAELHQTFANWNEGRLNSFLVEITADIFTQNDEQTPGDLIDRILDKAKQKGTGKWTSQSAMDVGIPIPTIDAAVTMRGISALREFRQNASEAYPSNNGQATTVNKEILVGKMEKALYFAFILTYAQGYHLLAAASEEQGYDLDLARIAKIWRGGCIIRAALLEDIRQAFEQNPNLPNLLLADQFKSVFADTRDTVVDLLHMASGRGIPTLCLSTSLQYFDAFRTARLPLNLVQAQRDYFGSHTYERVDQEGTFHTEWED